jgi:quercetin dioxygenase-like cupin family protein
MNTKITEQVMPIIDHHQASEVPWRPGYRKWDIAGHEQGVTSTFSINTAEPGTGAPLHTHTIDELIVIVGGKLEVKINGETHLVDKNHTLVIPPGAEHGFKVVGEDTAELLVFFPALDPYSTEHTHYLEGARPT